MSVMLLLAAASLPRPINPPLDDADYPADARRENRSAFITHEVIVSPNGHPLNCRIVVSGGADFDALTCASIMRRAIYKPALDDAGRPTYGVYRSQSAWTTGAIPPHPTKLYDITLTIRPVAKVKLPTSVTVILSVGADGRGVTCGPAPVQGEAVLLKVSCEQAMRLPAFPPISFDGHPVPSVRAVTVGFSLENATK